MKTTLLILSLTLLQNCSKSEDTFTPTLPPITQTGANTFGVYIDDKLLVPRDGEGTFNLPSYGMSYFVSGNVPTDFNSSLTAHDYKSGNAGLLQLNIEDMQNGEGEYQIKESNCQEWVGGNPPPTINLLCRWKDEQTGEIKIYCSIEGTGNLTILKYDRTNGILAGTFSCLAVNKDDPNDIIEITEGRFDIVWGTINEQEFP
ncbi:MAG: hypothetical protein L3J25_07145 [Flavobacteriaceae bacterium]|nr:hypothetical protein [Flavobacteriaceae bacterium]